MLWLELLLKALEIHEKIMFEKKNCEAENLNNRQCHYETKLNLIFLLNLSKTEFI